MRDKKIPLGAHYPFGVQAIMGETLAKDLGLNFAEKLHDRAQQSLSDKDRDDLVIKRLMRAQGCSEAEINKALAKECSDIYDEKGKAKVFSPHTKRLNK